MEDTGIIDLYWQRNSLAIDETDKKYGRMCRRLAENILGDFRDGEECVNDTYMETWQRLPPQRPAYFAAFLSAITRSRSIDRLRARTAAKRGGGEAVLAIDELAGILSAPGSVEERVEAKELGAAIDRFLDGLRETDRNIFVSRYWLCAGVAGIAKRQGFTESRVKSSLMRSRRKLKAYLLERNYI